MIDAGQHNVAYIMHRRARCIHSVNNCRVNACCNNVNATRYVNARYSREYLTRKIKLAEETSIQVPSDFSFLPVSVFYFFEHMCAIRVGTWL